LHRIPLRTGNADPRTAEKTPLLSEQASEENATVQSNPNPLELGAIPTIPTLPTSSATTLQVSSFLTIIVCDLFNVLLIKI
jgi:hypothetical protein